MIDVPVHVTHVKESENSVEVKGGSNWLIQQHRTAQDVNVIEEAAPVLPDFTKIKPQMTPTMVRYLQFKEDYTKYLVTAMDFEFDSYKLSKDQIKALRKLPKSTAGYTVVGFAANHESNPRDLSEKRAYNIAKILVTYNKGKVTVMEPGFGDSVNELVEGSSQRADIFEIPKN